MAPSSTIILCRHAQGEHNVTYDHTIHDAPLTPLGKMQATAIGPLTKDLQAKVDLICTSPLRRTLQTTQLGWKSAVNRLGIGSVICLPQAQECNDILCDTGSARDVLESMQEFAGFNFELLAPDWTIKKGFYAADYSTIANRARWIRQFLRSRPEENILLVTHGDILRRITATAEGPSQQRWNNAEVRIFKFDPEYVDTADCFLYQEKKGVAVGGYGPNSTEMINRTS